MSLQNFVWICRHDLNRPLKTLSRAYISYTEPSLEKFFDFLSYIYQIDLNFVLIEDLQLKFQQMLILATIGPNSFYEQVFKTLTPIFHLFWAQIFRGPLMGSEYASH